MFLNCQTLFFLSMFIFILCLVNLTYVPRLNVRKLWFWRSFWIFMFKFYILEHNSLLASQIFNKLQKILYSINIYILPCKLDLCATWIDQKVWFCRYFWIFLYILDLNLHLASQIFTKLKKGLILSKYLIFHAVNIIGMSRTKPRFESNVMLV